MEYRQLGASGLKVPVLSFGTATFGGGMNFLRPGVLRRLMKQKDWSIYVLMRGSTYLIQQMYIQGDYLKKFWVRYWKVSAIGC